jgi:hypothetical protein
MANTPTSSPASPTPSPTSNGASPTETPTGTAAVSRLITFRVDENEIDQGECVLFSWVAKGEDIGFVEFAENAKNPILVEEQGTHTVCPEGTNVYQLLVTWIDSTRTGSDILQVKVNEQSDSSGSGDSSAGGAEVVSPPGTFVAVTPVPILAPSAPSQATPVPGTSNSIVARPTGILGSVVVLPETGHSAASNDGGSMSGFILAGLLIMLLAGVVFSLSFLARYFQ